MGFRYVYMMTLRVNLQAKPRDKVNQSINPRTVQELMRIMGLFLSPYQFVEADVAECKQLRVHVGLTEDSILCTGRK
jgi:hypothetical protein